MKNDPSKQNREPGTRNRPTSPAFYFPAYGCEAVKPMTMEEMQEKEKETRAMIQKYWQHDGVKAVITYIEIQCATLQARACQKGADQHDAGQGFALQKLIGELQNKRWPQRG